MRVVLFDARVDRQPGQQRRGQRGGGAEHERQQHRRGAHAVGAQQRQQAPQVAPTAAAAGTLARPAARTAARAARTEPGTCAARVRRPYPCPCRRARSPPSSRGARRRRSSAPSISTGRRSPGMRWRRRSLGTARSARAARSWLPWATIRPCSSTTISSASAIVERRWAITNVVRPAIASARASLMLCSVEASTEEVASSRISTRGSATSARAIASRWRWPPDSVRPRSPTWVS